MLKTVSPYIDPADNTLKFAVIMTATGPTSWWWYPGLTGEQVGQYLTQNNAMLTGISAYIDTDATLKFAVIMAQGQGAWWWWWGQSGAQVGQLLTQNNAMLTDISAYVDPADNTLEFAVVMAKSQGGWWWWGQSGAQLGQLLTQNNARLAAASAYLTSSENSITLNGYPNVSGLDGKATLTIQQSGAYSFSGSWSPSNFATGLISQDVNFVMTLPGCARHRVGFLHLRYRTQRGHVQLQQQRDEPVIGCELAVLAACLYRARPGQRRS